MKLKKVSRREFVRRTGLLTGLGYLTMAELADSYGMVTHSLKKSLNHGITVSTDFVNGGGDVEIVDSDPIIVKIKPHDEGDGGWSQVWWHFKVEGVAPGSEMTLHLDIGEPPIQGISPQIYFSYDQNVWGLTTIGIPAQIDERKVFTYKHVVKGNRVWFAYDLPYTPQQVETWLMEKVKRDSRVTVFELCKTLKNRPVYAFRINGYHDTPQTHGIWLQARAHAFESGASWVLHELALWLISDDAAAKALREVSSITIVPIVDVDGVVEGRTGKNHPPYDQNRGWEESPNHWPETTATKTHLEEMTQENKLDMFIDFHGPGALHHPYFIVPEENSLPFTKQRENRARFFEILAAEPLDDKARATQSMTKIHYSERPWEKVKDISCSWVTMNTTAHNIAMTLEVNMNTPLSTREGYRAEAQVLGLAIAEYFV